MVRCVICYSDDDTIDDFIACEFCTNDFHINHIAHWITIEQRCPVCKKIFSLEFITHLEEASDSVNFDNELMDAFRRDLEIEGSIEVMQNDEYSSKSTKSFRFYLFQFLLFIIFISIGVLFPRFVAYP